MKNPYATDGKCHNANHGTYGHECGKPATWIGRKASGFESGFCDHCRQHGDEAREFASFRPIVPFVDVCNETAYGTTTRLSFAVRVF
jgi:hypothetical protein